MTTLHQTFSKLRDPRINRHKKHLLLDIIVLSILAVLSGAESYDSIELYGNTNIEFLKKILKLPHGIPSHDTINRVFSLLNPKKFEKLFIEWSETQKSAGVFDKVIAIDGKTVRGSKGMQRAIAEKIIDCGADYILLVKDNQNTCENKLRRSVAGSTH